MLYTALQHLKNLFFFGFKRDNKNMPQCVSEHIEIRLSCVRLGPVLVWSVQGGSATLAARSAPCQTPGCSSPSALPGWSWCGCSGPLHRIPGTRQFADGTSRSHRQSAPPAPGPSPWQQSEWAGGRCPLGRGWMSGLVWIIHFSDVEVTTQIFMLKWADNHTYILQLKFQHLQMKEGTVSKNVLL